MLSITYFVLVLILIIRLISSQITSEDIDELRIEIRAKIDDSGNNHQMLAPIVRLIFHDCGGPIDVEGDSISRCNGCIDGDNIFAHAGLQQSAITPLQDVYAAWEEDMNVADFWALAATFAIEYAQELDVTNPGDTLPSIPYYFGRTACPTAPEAVDTKQFVGAGWGWKDVSKWFQQQLNFTERETVTIAGAHTLGKCHQQFSGYSSIRWKRRGPDQLNNEYYQNLFNFEWQQRLSPTGLWEWISVDRGREILMLNSDLAMILDIDDYVDLDDDGIVSCAYTDCPHSRVRDIAQEFADDNQKWLDEFAAVFTKLITTGYDVATLNLVVDVDNANSVASFVYRDESKNVSKEKQYFNGNMVLVIFALAGVGCLSLIFGFCIGRCMNIKQETKAF